MVIKCFHTNIRTIFGGFYSENQVVFFIRYSDVFMALYILGIME